MTQNTIEENLELEVTDQDYQPTEASFEDDLGLDDLDQLIASLSKKPEVKPVRISVPPQPFTVLFRFFEQECRHCSGKNRFIHQKLIGYHDKVKKLKHYIPYMGESAEATALIHQQKITATLTKTFVEYCHQCQETLVKQCFIEESTFVNPEEIEV